MDTLKSGSKLSLTNKGEAALNKHFVKHHTKNLVKSSLYHAFDV